MSALLAFSFGPVQPFIAQARKTRDLWMGSYLLSSLIRRSLPEAGGDVLFPVLTDLSAESVLNSPGIADLPNRFVAMYSDLAAAQRSAEQVERAIERVWNEIAGAVWQYVFPHESDPALIAIWRRQTAAKALFEFYWVAVPYSDSGDSSARTYGDTYRRAQELLDARKRLRSFIAADEPGEKSTISGEREALHRGHSPAAAPADDAPSARQSVQTFWRDLAQRFPEAQFGRDGRERLDAIEVIKRFAGGTPAVGQAPRFPSTDTIAAAPFLRDLIERLQREPGPSPLLNTVNAWTHVLKGDSGTPLYTGDLRALPGLSSAIASGFHHALLRHDAQALHPTSFSPRRLQEEGVASENLADTARRGTEAVRELWSQARKDGVAPPSSYYALLLLDGDRMGQLLSSLTNTGDHQRLSQTLSAFARHAPRTIVEQKHLGRVVYAGGDDVLAFVPLATALEAARALRQAYGEAMLPVSRDASASAGLAIAHRRMPLAIVLQTAREAERAAKQRYGRDAIAIILLPRSGAATQVAMHWRYTVPSGFQAERPLDAIEFVLAVSRRMREGDLSGHFAYSLARIAPVLGALEAAAQRAEVTRLLRRHRAPDRHAQFPDADLEMLAEQAVVLSGALHREALRQVGPSGQRLPEDLAHQGPRQGLVELSGWLLLAEFLARGGDED